MDRVIYTALTGLSARSRAQQVTANNLANANTTGFRRELIAAEGRYLAADARAQATTPGARSRAQAGAPSLTTPREPGRVTNTGRALDVALGENSWLTVQGPLKAGLPTEAYSRRGDLSISASGILQTGEGRAVLGENGQPITVPAGTALDIAPDGSLSIRTPDGAQPLGKLKLVAGGTTASGFDKATDSLFTSKDSLPVDPAARLTVGALEGSNVESSAALAELVEQSRGFEVSAKLLSIAREIDERTSRLMAMENQ